ncbi:antA/AntB antirepressor family protein [Tranquillimonas rosea]|uniref:antA/AntB antirepressor family protein n=1 Tax=Tranquillimonas rosea TaxID=641238 RepID=UPI003BA98FBE
MKIAIKDGNINGEAIQTVDARELHAFLEVGKDFSTWIKDRIGQYAFEEGRDYVCVTPQNGGAKRGGHNRLEYHISLDMAKELSMVERNQRGKEARQYFIDCERQAKEAAAQPRMIDLDDPAMVRGLLANYVDRAERAESQLVECQPKVEAYDRLDKCEGSMGVRVASKTLDYPERKLAKWLEVNGWAFRQNGRGPLQAYSQRRKDGFLEHKLNYYSDPKTGEEKVSATLMITPKGLSRLAQILPTEGGAA